MCHKGRRGGGEQDPIPSPYEWHDDERTDREMDFFRVTLKRFSLYQSSRSLTVGSYVGVCMLRDHVDVDSENFPF